MIEFETISSTDMAAVYLESSNILYDSDCKYYRGKFENAATSSERAQWSPKVIEYADLIEWKFLISMGDADENGWGKLK